MSSIPTKQIDGDVAVGRNVSVGGNATVRGSATIGHNLKVEGWLDAKNIKGPNKGIFLDETKLRETYPLPHDGWWALVGNTLPAPLYIADGGAWVATGESAGNPTIDSQQYNDAVAALDADLKELANDVSANAQSIEQIRTQINTIGSSVNTLTTDVSGLKTSVSNAETRISTAEGNIRSITDSKGSANGLATLDAAGRLPASQMPEEAEEVVEFERFASVSEVSQQTLTGEAHIMFNLPTKTFIAYATATWASNWAGAFGYGTPTENGYTPAEGRIYVCKDDDALYRWNGTDLVLVGSGLQLGTTSTTAYSGDKGLRLEGRADTVETQLSGVNILPFDGTWEGAGTEPSTGLWYCPNDASGAVFKCFGATTFATYGRAEADYTTDAIYRCGSELFHIVDGKMMPLSGSAVGNTFNATVEIPLPAGEYYSDINAETQTHDVLSAVFNHGVASVGLQITFAIGARTWKTYQYVGVNDTWTQFQITDNWIDLAGMSAGSEAIINIDDLVPRTVDGYYTLDSAIDALLTHIQSTGIDYSKGGLIITFQVGQYAWETYQFTGLPTDLSNRLLWKTFGAGGGSVVTSSEIAKDGTDAFSTGGAYALEKERMIVDFDQGEDAEAIILQGVNSLGAPIGSAMRIPKSSGSGTASGSSLSIYLENAAPYAAYGSAIQVRAAIKSVSYDGDTEVLGVIRTLSIEDASTGLTLWSDTVNTNSSTSATDFKFTLDFTDYFSGAASKDFRIVATDADGNSKSRTITVTAVDVTCTCVNPLNYTTANSLEEGGSLKNIPMYKFANNVSKQGVTVKTEMYYGGWRTLGEATVTDTFTHYVSINPQDVFGGGEVMEHGCYALRIQGTDVASGVKGNTVYTAVMCINPAITQPVVALRYDDTGNGTIRLYDTLTLQVAAYTSGKTSTDVNVYLDGVKITSLTAQSGSTYTVSKQIQGYASDGTKTLTAYAESDAVNSVRISVTVQGSAIGAELKEGALFGYDFASRSNDESDHTITDNGYTMAVEGANWSSNGFRQYLGETALRIAENVTATIPYAPFSAAATERTNGMAFQFAFATNNIKDSEAKLMECYDADSGAGFYICGNKVVLYCKNGTPQTATRSFRSGEKITVGVAVEPSTKTVARGSTDYSTVKLYLNGEEVAAIGYVANSGAILNTKQITFNGTDGDLYLYYVLAYDSYYEWVQAFSNYLCKLTDTDAMIEEYEVEDVLDSRNTPSLDALKEREIPYYVVVAPQATFDSFDSDINTSTNFLCTLYYFHPTMPWRSFKAENVRWRRQGTTSAKRPVKNDRFYLQKEKNWKITALNPDYTNDDALKTYELFNIGYVRVGENTIPVKIITVKVDYSDSSNANDCGVCDMMNATFRAMGSSYMTPAQRAFDGTWSKSGIVVNGLEMNHSTANHPIAAFRATLDSLTDAWFHAKGNWKEDKGEQVALGFQDTPGYNKGCLNYGDFIEFFGTEGETLDEIETRFKSTAGLDTSMPYLLSQYCGRDYRIMRYSGGAWAKSSGSMKQVDGKWVIEGDVLNPVSGYELLTYDAFNWWQGVGSVADMMAPTTTESSWVTKLNLGQASYPAWTRYFECMIDDDQLQTDLAMGRKVPYDLYLVMKFCDSVDYSKEALADTWKELWRTDAWKYMSVQSLMSYYTFTDYLAAVDQQAKNMQPMFFLEDGCQVVDGVYSSPNAMQPVRMYFNKVYDCDTCNGKDNDGGNTIPSELDPATDTQCYAGRGSVLWNDLRGQQEMIVDASGNTLTLTGVVATMRNLPEVEGIGAGPFSPKGANYYFVEKRLKTWPKKVSSYDGERKYINYTGYNDIYFYALQGLGLTSLPAFIEQRWRIRDGYYQTGDFKDASHILGGRIGAKEGAVIKFRAAKTGYFGIGNDSGNVTQGMYLQAGEEGVFTDFQHGDNILLYIYQADRMSEIDLSQLSLDVNFQFSVMKLVQKITLGGADHGDWTLSPGNTGFLTNLQLGDLPFLRELDVRNAEIQTVNASQCPRLEKLLGEGSAMTTLSLAETSPLNTLTLPASMSALSLVNLPQLVYPATESGAGLTIANFANVQRLILSGCPNIDAKALISNVAASATLKYVRLPYLDITAPSSILASLKASGTIGLDPSGQAYEESGQCSGLTGRWIMQDLIEDNVLREYAAYFPQLSIYNSQFTAVVFDDTIDDPKNITNLENGTTGDSYEASGHIVRIRKGLIPVKGKLNTSTGKWEGVKLSEANYQQLADGTDFDYTDSLGSGNDAMMRCPHFWYKGVNDFKNQKKYIFWSSLTDEPISTAKKITRKRLSEIVYAENKTVQTTDVVTGVSTLSDSGVAVDTANYNIYAVEVSGMKQVRWPGQNHSGIGAVFTDSAGVIVGKFNLAVSGSMFDFDESSGDYVFCDVPENAAMFYFSSKATNGGEEVIAVDSAEVEAIEPDWVENVPWLCGVYEASVDSLTQIRSISGATVKTGTGTSTTSSEWTYDASGRATNTPLNAMNYTQKDFQNLAMRRGEGYQLIDYEMSKLMAILWFSLRGTRDAQLVCGYGSRPAGGTTGYIDAIGNADNVRGSSYNGNKCLGFESFFACTWELMDNVAVNVVSWQSYLQNHGEEIPSDPIDAKWHIYDPTTQSERVVQGITRSGVCIGRVKHGRYCDVIASKCTADNSKWASNYCDSNNYSASRCRVVGRANDNAFAGGGLVFASAGSASSNSYSGNGSRLAFRGGIEISE